MPPRKPAVPQHTDPEICRLEIELNELVLEMDRFRRYSEGRSKKFQENAMAQIDAAIAAKQAELAEYKSTHPAS
jgi:hypothetical protein